MRGLVAYKLVAYKKTKCSKSIPGFSISRLANVEDFFNVNIFFKCKLNINVSINDHSLYLCSMLLKTSFLLPHLFCNVDFELNQLIEFQNKTNTENYWVLVNAFWIRLRFVKYRFVRYRFVRYWLRFVSRPWLDTDIPSKHFVYLEDVFSVTIFCLPRRLEDVFKTYLQDIFQTSWKTKTCYTEDMLKTSSRHVLKTSSTRLEYQQMFASVLLNNGT